MRFILQNNAELRTYMAIELKAGCGSRSVDTICRASLGDPALETQISRRIDEVVDARTSTRGSMTSVDYTLLRQPFPFTWIVALKSQTAPYALLMLELPRGNHYTEVQVAAKYGPPQERGDDEERFPVLSYKADSASYAAKAVFRIDPASGEVQRLTIRLQRHARRR